MPDTIDTIWMASIPRPNDFSEIFCHELLTCRIVAIASGTLSRIGLWAGTT